MKKPQLAVGQFWEFGGLVVQITGWGQDGGGDGIVRFFDIEEPSQQCSMIGKYFREDATLILDGVLP